MAGSNARSVALLHAFKQVQSSGRSAAQQALVRSDAGLNQAQVFDKIKEISIDLSLGY